MRHTWGGAFYWKHVGSRLTARDVSSYNTAFNVGVATYTNWPGAATDGRSTWARMWVSSLIAAGVKYVPGKTWHDSQLDYLASIYGQNSPFHSDYIFTQIESLDDPEEGTSASARWSWMPFGANRVRLTCAHFNMLAPVQASNLLHESWHAAGVSHYQGNGGDYYMPHEKSAIARGEMDRQYVPLNAPSDSYRVRQSVAQTQYHFACDIITSPHRWVTNRVIGQAREAIWDAKTRLLNFADSGAIECSDPTIQPDTQGGPPRILRVQVHGMMLDGTPGPFPDTVTPIDLDVEVPVVPGQTFDSFNGGKPISYRADDDDTLFKFYVQAYLDGDIVRIRYQGEFYEDPPDCESDTSPQSRFEEGAQCKGVNNPAAWRTTGVDSQLPAIVEPPMFLNNCWNEDCADYANFTVSFEAKW